MTKAMPFLQKYDITFLRPPPIRRGIFIRTDKKSTLWVLFFYTNKNKKTADGSYP